MPAERSGLKSGDEIRKVNGKDLISPVEFPSLVQDSQGRPMNLEVQRGDRTLQVDVRPQQVSLRTAFRTGKSVSAFKAAI